MEFEVRNFEITAATHPAGYTNKVLFGSRQGPLQLWNIMHDKLIYTFTGWGEQVTVLEQVYIYTCACSVCLTLSDDESLV